MERLLGAIMLRAIQDWDNPKYQADVEDFVLSGWFDIVAESQNLEPANAREKFLGRSYERVSMRGAYR